MSRSVPEFHGPLADHFSRFVKKMLGTGGQHVSLFASIRRLDCFLVRRWPGATSLTKEILADWFSSFDHLKPQTQRRYRSATFQICKYLRGHDADTGTIHDFEPLRRSRAFRPHIFTPEEINTLLRAALDLSTRPMDPLRPWTMELILALLYTAGLRIGEVVRLDIGDYDPDEGTLVIRETKFAKTRQVPLSPSAKTKVDSYLDRRRKLGLACSPGASLLWPFRHGVDGARPRLGCVQAALVRLMRQCGLKPGGGSGRRGARVHDMRHTFAVHRILAWYRQGVDVQARLPHLATYMGHVGVESTQLYLSAIPEILSEASDRFRRFASPSEGEEEVDE